MSLTVFALRARAELLLRFAFREWTVSMTGGRGLLNAESVMMCLMAPEDVFEAFGGPELRDMIAQVPESAPGQAVDVICRALRESSVPPVAAALEWINARRDQMPWLAADDGDIPQSVLDAAGAAAPEAGDVEGQTVALARQVGPKMFSAHIDGVTQALRAVAPRWGDDTKATPEQVDAFAEAALQMARAMGPAAATALLQRMAVMFTLMGGGGVVIAPGGEA